MTFEVGGLGLSVETMKTSGGKDVGEGIRGSCGGMIRGAKGGEEVLVRKRAGAVERGVSMSNSICDAALSRGEKESRFMLLGSFSNAAGFAAEVGVP